MLFSSLNLIDLRTSLIINEIISVKALGITKDV